MENVITVLFKFTPTPTKIRLNGSITTSGWWWPRKVWRRGGEGRGGGYIRVVKR